MALNGLPFVSCVMPTYGRPAFIGESVKMFLDQDYPSKELVVLNDCAGQVYVSPDPSVRVVNTDARFPSLGEKRNATIELAQGDIIAVWDDDDVYLPWRLSFGVVEMLRLKTPFYRPAEFWAYWGDSNLHNNQSVPGWVNHALVLFDKSLWDNVGRYASMGVGEDADFFARIHRYLGKAFIVHPLAAHQRPFILRGKSLYRHLSIVGGENGLDTSRGQHPIQPRPIQDPVLRGCYDSLIATRSSILTAIKQAGPDLACDRLEAMTSDATGGQPAAPKVPASLLEFSVSLPKQPSQRERFIYITALYNERRADRTAEYIECLNRVAEHPLVEDMYVFYEQSKDDSTSHILDYLRRNSIHTIVSERRPLFRDLFDLANTQVGGRRVIIANADIYFDDSLGLLSDRDMNGELICLSRWDVRPDGSLPTMMHFPGSQDVWIFQSPLRIDNCAFPMGRLGCDNRIAYEAKSAGLDVGNPCRSIRCYHLHLSAVRNYNHTTRIHGPYADLPPHHLFPRPSEMVPDDNNRIVCPASAGRLCGRHIALEDVYGLPNIGYWIDANDSVRWEFGVKAPALMAVDIEYSLDPNSVGAEAVVTVNESALTVDLETTGSWSNFRVVRVGTVQVDERQGQQLRVAASRKAGVALMNLRKVTLQPASPGLRHAKEAMTVPTA